MEQDAQTRMQCIGIRRKIGKRPDAWEVREVWWLPDAVRVHQDAKYLLLMLIPGIRRVVEESLIILLLL